MDPSRLGKRVGLRPEVEISQPATEVVRILVAHTSRFVVLQPLLACEPVEVLNEADQLSDELDVLAADLCHWASVEQGSWA